MLESVFSMIRSVSAMAVISMLLEYLMPGGAFQSSIRIVIGMVFLSIIIRPIIQILDLIA